MQTISKKEIIEQIAEQTGSTKKDAGLMLNAFENVILDTVRDGNKFFMRGLFTLTPYVRAETQRRNPQTGEIIIVPEKDAIRFSVGKTLKEVLEG